MNTQLTHISVNMKQVQRLQETEDFSSALSFPGCPNYFTSAGREGSRSREEKARSFCGLSRGQGDLHPPGGPVTKDFLILVPGGGSMKEEWIEDIPK